METRSHEAIAAPDTAFAAAHALGHAPAPVRTRHDIDHVSRPCAAPVLPDAESIRPAFAVGGGPCAVDAWTLMRVLDEIDYGVMLVDDDARVRYANRVALQECAGARGLRLDEGRVSPRGSQDVPSFHRALLSSSQGRRSLLNVEAGASALSLAVVPLTGAPLASARTLLVMGKRETCPPLTVDFFARAHHLTVAECAVLRGLCNGLRPTEIAEGGGVAISTVRTQIGAIRAKTGTTGIRELVGRVAALPPIASVPHKLVRDGRLASAASC